MKDIGGYFELEHYEGQEYYPDLFKFNLGRTAIAWFLSQVGCKYLYVPYFLCDSVTDACRKAGIKLTQYKINRNFTPCIPDLPHPPLPSDTWILVANHYGQLSDEQIRDLKEMYENVLFDMTHAFFQKPLPGIDTVSSVRKFFGVSDGAYLNTDRPISMPQETDQSHTRMSHILGRFEESAGVHYQEMLDNAHSYDGAPARVMSPLTQNLLSSLSYDKIAHQRMQNYLQLHIRLGAYNSLQKHGILKTPLVGPFCYPFQVHRGIELRKKLARQHIFVPTYWSTVIERMPKESLEYQYAANILALPCDQRYHKEDMDLIVDTILALMEESHL